MSKNKFMEIAKRQSIVGMKKEDGGPFGAVIVKDGEIIAKGHNMVLVSNDPTNHAEIVAIRKACKKLGRFDLSDCEIYSSCEPCPMCFSAIHWAKIKKCYYGCTAKDAENIGFDDKFIYDAIKGNSIESKLEMIPMDREECLKAFEMWANKNNKVMY